MDTPLPRGARVEKINSKPEDTHHDGALARVLDPVGPALPESGAPGTYGYFVEWDSHPGIPCFIAGTRLRTVTVD
jgi:hypothetical protein